MHPEHRDSPGNTGASPCLQMEMPRRRWSGILRLQTRIPGGCIRDRHSRDGFPEGIVCSEQRKQLGATPAHFQGSSLRPHHPINHCGGKEPAPRFPVTRPQLLRYCISPRGKVSGHILLLLGGAPLLTPATPGVTAAPALQEQPGAEQCGAVSSPVQGAWDGMGAWEHGMSGADTSLHPASASRYRAPSSPHPTECTHTLLCSLNPTLRHSALNPAGFKPAVQHRLEGQS